jgi:tetratricopeptide (TPR) repeat protein
VPKVPHDEKAWIPRVLDYLTGAQTLASFDLAYSLGLSVMLFHDGIEIAIRCWLRYDQRRAPREVRDKDFHHLLEELRLGFPTLSGTVLNNLAFLQDKRNSLVHDVAGAPVTKNEWQRIRNSCVAATEALLGEVLNLELLVSSVASPDGPTVSGIPPSHEQLESSRLLNSAVKLFYQGRLAETERTVREVLSRNSSNPTALHLVGLCERKRRRFSMALQSFLAAVELPGGEHDILLYLDLAEAQLTVGQAKEAASTSLKTLDLGAKGPERGRAYAIAGASSTELGDFTTAEQYYREALTEDPKHQRHIRGLLDALRHLGRYEETIHFANAAHTDAPKNTNYLLDRARLFWDRNLGQDREKALQDLDEAEQLASGKGNSVFLTRAYFLRATGISMKNEGNLAGADEQLRKAIAQLQRGLLNSPKNYRPTLRNIMSLLFIDLGDGANAIREARQGLSENPAYVSNYMALARALIYSKRFQEGSAVASQGYDRAPAQPGKFWCNFMRLVAEVLQNRVIEGWEQQREGLRRLGQGLREGGFELEPVWTEILTCSKALNADSKSQLGELALIAHLPEPS